MLKARIFFLPLLLLLAFSMSNCNVLSLPNVAGTWDLTFYIEGSNCPAEMSPPMTKQVWIVQQQEDRVVIVIQSVDGRTVNFEFAVSAKLQADGNFSFNETFYHDYKSYYLRINIICNATITGSTVSGVAQLSVQDQDTMQSCVEHGRVEGTRR